MTSSENVRPAIEFGTDGIRGIAGQYPLDPVTVVRIGRGIGRWLRQSRSRSDSVALLGRDTRISGHVILHALATGLMAEGVQAVNLGVITTPGVALMTSGLQYELGIVISASHNPFEQNGIKLFGRDGFKLSDDEEEAIETSIAGVGPDDPAPLGGQFESSFTTQSYETTLLNTLGPRTLANLRVVLDVAQGAAYRIAPEVFRHAEAKVFALNVTPDGVNINVEAGSEHVRRDRSAILKAIQDQHADLGIAFDGDADRVVFVTPDGMLIDGDHTLGILAFYYHQQGKLAGNTIVATEMTNSGVQHFLAAQGIKLIRTKVGDRYVMDEMRRGGYILGGEQAGHIILLENGFTAGDGIYAALRIAELCALAKRNSGPSISDLAQRIPRYPQVIASAQLSARIDLGKVAGLQALQDETLASFNGKGRVNLRFSGTEPNMLRAMVEGGPSNSLVEVVGRALTLCNHVAQAVGTADPKVDIVDCMTGTPINRKSMV